MNEEMEMELLLNQLVEGTSIYEHEIREIKANSMGGLIDNPWFAMTVATNQDDFGLEGGSGTETAPMKDGETNAEDDGHSKGLD
ncbi:hypothetical protein HAX54_043184 [Datura stramonium]|uniref:Uncharacterized protein n=1 Tax=Datura stramonium TaxID=4076 RepID=A0ABS8SN26_DATST|nr:hypothetical protein [Datura stramonium]